MLAMGIAEGVQAKACVFGLAVVVLHITPPLGVKLVEPAWVPSSTPGDAEVPESVTATWQTIPNSVFNFLTILYADTSGIEELVANATCRKWVIMVFTMLTDSHRGHWPQLFEGPQICGQWA